MGGARGARPSPFFLAQTEARRAEKKISPGPPLSQGLDERPPPPHLSEGLDRPLFIAS